MGTATSKLTNYSIKIISTSFSRKSYLVLVSTLSNFLQGSKSSENKQWFTMTFCTSRCWREMTLSWLSITNHKRERMPFFCIFNEGHKITLQTALNWAPWRPTMRVQMRLRRLALSEHSSTSLYSNFSTFCKAGNSPHKNDSMKRMDFKQNRGCFSIP